LIFVLSKHPVNLNVPDSNASTFVNAKVKQH